MTVRLIQPTEAIEVSQICCLFFGQPGSRKTSLVQTADNPITLVFDPGIYRVYDKIRKRCVMFGMKEIEVKENGEVKIKWIKDPTPGAAWHDVLAFDLSPYNTVNVDTVNMCLESLAEVIILQDPKNRKKSGGLSLNGYGDLKDAFATWVNKIKATGKDIVFIAQEDELKIGGEPYYCPLIVGRNYDTLMHHCDVVGYMHFDSGERVINFNPTDNWMAKSPPCGWSRIKLPDDFAKEPRFLQQLLDKARASMGRISQANAIVAVVAEFKAELAEDPNIQEFNELWARGPTLSEPAKSQVKALLQAHATKFKLDYDKETKMWNKIT